MSTKAAPLDVTEPVSFSDALSERYLAYALSTIMSRSLPDVRDGLKPVHRRLLYAMLQLKLDPKAGFKKCARVVGDVIGKYHPHGDVAVYDTLVRLAQDFSVRYPLIEGQGNFGSIDGDNPAAMRYTESRLTTVALALMQDLDKATVSFKPTYDGQELEPEIFPANFPNLLANGAEGIAVGMATSIPPHNVHELCDALLALIKSPGLTVSDLMQYIPGPDFPTGGVIVESPSAIKQAYETGKGSFRVRAKWHKEPLMHGLYQIVVTEIPYQLQKARLIEKMATLYKDKKLVLLGNIRDESTDEIRLILEPKSRTIDPDMLMESLFKLTDLEVRFHMNMNVLTPGSVPQVLNLKEILVAFLAHRKEVITNRSHHRLGQIAQRLEVVNGLIIAYLNLDELIAIIREYDDAKQRMMKKWDLTELQAEAILNMRLRSLRKLEEMELRKEQAELLKEQEELEEILAKESKLWQVITQDIKVIQKQFGNQTDAGKRRTTFAEKPIENTVISIEAFIEKEPITVYCSQMGWIRAVKGHQTDHSEVKYKEGDAEGFILTAHTTDKLIIASASGRFFTLGCDKIPRGKGHGDSLRLMIDLTNDDETLSLFIFEPQQHYILAGSNGKGFCIPSEELLAQTKNGKQIFNVTEGEKLVCCRRVTGDMVAAIGENRKMIVFALDEVPVMKRGQGVALQKYKQGKFSDLITFEKSQGLSWKLGERVRTETDITAWLGKRAGSGRLAPTGFPKNNKFVVP